MKKILKPIISLFVVITLFVSVLCVNVSAASVTLTGGEFNVGQAVKIVVRFTADATLYAVEADVNYNSSVLRLNSVSGADFNVGNGSVKIVDDKFSATNPTKTASYTLNFTAIAAGNSNISVSVLGGGEATSKAAASVNVKVVTPKPSSNANLGSITVDGVALSPAFNPNTTTYNATVKYSVATVNIKGSVADGGATYVGGGNWELKVGDNSRTLTVTAADGTKKAYTVNIKRMTEEETTFAEQEARDNNPLLVIIDGADYTIVNDYANITVPAGFTQGTATRKEKEVAVLNDEHGEYQLFVIADAEGKTAFYTRDENDVFTRINYINAYSKMFIIEAFDKDDMPDDFVKATRTIDGVEVDVYNYADEALKDFFVVKCYVGGARAYYKVDTVEGTMQRASEFYATPTEEQEPEQPDNTAGSGIDWFKNMNTTGKTVFVIMVFLAVAMITVAIILIVKIASKGKNSLEEDYTQTLNDDFVLNDFDINNSKK